MSSYSTVYIERFSFNEKNIEVVAVSDAMIHESHQGWLPVRRLNNVSFVAEVLPNTYLSMYLRPRYQSWSTKLLAMSRKSAPTRYCSAVRGLK